MADIQLGQLLHRPTIDPISGTSPLPVQISGSGPIVELNARAGLAVAAGATVTAIALRAIYGRRCTFIAEHQSGSEFMSVGYRLWTDSNKALSGADIMIPDANTQAASVTFDVTAPKAYFRVKNGAATEMLFDCDLYFWPN